MGPKYESSSVWCSGGCSCSPSCEPGRTKYARIMSTMTCWSAGSPVASSMEHAAAAPVADSSVLPAFTPLKVRSQSVRPPAPSGGAAASALVYSCQLVTIAVSRHGHQSSKMSTFECEPRCARRGSTSDRLIIPPAKRYSITSRSTFDGSWFGGLHAVRPTRRVRSSSLASSRCCSAPNGGLGSLQSERAAVPPVWRRKPGFASRATKSGSSASDRPASRPGSSCCRRPARAVLCA